MILGIDVGASGSLCSLDNSETTFVDYTYKGLRGYIDYIESIKNISLCVVEEVHSMPGQGVKSMFSFGQRFGEIQGILQAFKVPYILIKPTVWKKFLNIPAKSDKHKSAEIIQNIFPKAILHTERGRLLDGRSDALCLAHYGQLYLQGKK